jgi:hypothetical protein
MEDIAMTKNIFSQIIVFIATILMILMFFFPNVKSVKSIITERLDVITFLLVIGLYIKDMMKSNI